MTGFKRKILIKVFKSFSSNTASFSLWYPAVRCTAVGPAPSISGAPVAKMIHYVDITFLYLYVNANFVYPTGHPKIILRDFKDAREYFGLIKAVLHPPQGLYLPVLPYRTSQGKFVFSFCHTFEDTNNQTGPCMYSDEERALHGTWTTPEFLKSGILSKDTARYLWITSRPF